MKEQKDEQRLSERNNKQVENLSLDSTVCYVFSYHLSRADSSNTYTATDQRYTHKIVLVQNIPQGSDKVQAQFPTLTLTVGGKKEKKQEYKGKTTLKNQKILHQPSQNSRALMAFHFTTHLTAERPTSGTYLLLFLTVTFWKISDNILGN